MERILTYSIENCFVCSEFMMEDFKNDLKVVTAYSEKPIYHFLEQFTNIQFSSEVIDEAGICQNCFIRFNEYDEHKTITEKIQSELVALFDSSNEQAEMKEEKATDGNEVIFETIGEPDGQLVELFFDSEETKAEQPQFTLVECDWMEPKTETPEFLKPKPRPRGDTSDDSFTVLLLEDNTKVFQCETCSRTFKEKSKLKSHRQIHTTERNVICPICHKSFKTDACLRSHKRVHNPTYMYCDFCGKCYTQKPEILKHIKFVHFHIRNYFCDICEAGFGSKGHLIAHKLIHQDQTSKAMVCGVCTLAFHTRAKLDRHMKTHTKERNYECGICQKRFLYSYNVTAHIKHVHYRKKRKPNDRICRLCEKKFDKVWKLNEHLEKVHQVVETKAEEVEDIYEEYAE